MIGVMLFQVGGAATIAVKYALYPEAILADESEPLHIKSKAYEEAKVRDRNLMMTYILNATGLSTVTSLASWPQPKLCAVRVRI